ncbi:SH3 domain-containing protein [Bacillota bacterium Meth-B3]|nr:SH3 domain-containing protein [Christensenellaceae bacterium]MEA5065111.1 SH3 domain-containing protein [Eubacteriales bacterium]
MGIVGLNTARIVGRARLLKRPERGAKARGGLARGACVCVMGARVRKFLPVMTATGKLGYVRARLVETPGEPFGGVLGEVTLARLSARDVLRATAKPKGKALSAMRPGACALVTGPERAGYRPVMLLSGKQGYLRACVLGLYAARSEAEISACEEQPLLARVRCQALAVRSLPGSAGERIGELNADETVRACRRADGWCRVEMRGGGVGYADGRYLDFCPLDASLKRQP